MGPLLFQKSDRIVVKCAIAIGLLVIYGSVFCIGFLEKGYSIIVSGIMSVVAMIVFSIVWSLLFRYALRVGRDIATLRKEHKEE